MAEAFIHKQLDKLTSDMHRRTIHGVDEESKRLISPKILPTQKQINLCVNFSTVSHRHCLLPLLICGTQLQNSLSAKLTSHYVFDLILLKLVQYTL